MPIPYLKNKGPLLVDKVRGYFDRLPPWLRDVVTIRSEKQKVDAKISDLDPAALESELKQEVTDEKLRTNRYLGDGADGSGNDMSGLPASHLSEVVITQTGQVADVTETVGATETHLVEGPPLQDGTSEQVGDLWVTKKVEAETFDRKSYQQQKEDLLPPEFRAAIPQKTETHVVDGAAIMPTLGPIDLARKEEQVKVGVKETTVQSRDTSGTKPTLSGQRIDPEFNGATLNMAKTVVPVGTVIGQTFGYTDGKVTPYDNLNSVKEIWGTDAAGFPQLLLRRYDPELNVTVLTDLNIVQMGSTYTPAGWWILDYEDRKLDSKHMLRIQNRVESLPPTERTYSTQMITFPSILSYISFALVALATPATGGTVSEVQWTAGVRASFNSPALLVVDKQYFTSVPSPIGLFAWKPTDISYKGISYSVSLPNVLTDQWGGVGVTFAGDAKYGNLQDRFNILATVPSATTYTNSIGTFQPISSVVERYKRLWTRTDTLVQIQ